MSFRNMGEPAGISGLFCIGRDLPRGIELSELGAEECVEWRSELRLDGDAALCGVINDDQDLLEERLVEHSLDVIRR
ncbi:MAG TPA: hypothetical protein PLL22_06860 [Microbacteriaceae bacterium]|nr:hypothetical protein [Microbacteriaceae bacterium]